MWEKGGGGSERRGGKDVLLFSFYLLHLFLLIHMSDTVDVLALQGFSQLPLLLLFLLGVCFRSSLLNPYALLKKSHQINDVIFDRRKS